jgi:hypothetical protein
MRRLCLAAAAAAIAFAASPAAAGGCCWDAPTIVYGAPPVDVVVPPTGYLLDPSDSYRPVYWVDRPSLYYGPHGFALGVPTHSEGGYAFPFEAYPYVRSYYGDRWFTAPRRSGWRSSGVYGRRVLDRPRIVRAGVGNGHFAPPYDAYRYRVAPSARVIHVDSAMAQR